MNLIKYLINNNKLERDFQICKHHLISQRENTIMGYTIVSGNRPSSVALHVHHNHAIVFIEILKQMQKFYS